MEIETRTVVHDNGRVEIIRVLNEKALKKFKEWNPVAYEASVVWLEDISKLPFARMMWATRCTSRRGELIPEGGARILGYTRLTQDAPLHPETGFYTRRIFYLRPQDEAPGATPPPGAVDPKTVLPCVVGESVSSIATATEAPMVRVRREAAAAALIGDAKPDVREKKKQLTPLGVVNARIRKAVYSHPARSQHWPQAGQRSGAGRQECVFTPLPDFSGSRLLVGD